MERRLCDTRKVDKCSVSEMASITHQQGWGCCRLPVPLSGTPLCPHSMTPATHQWAFLMPVLCPKASRCDGSGGHHQPSWTEELKTPEFTEHRVANNITSFGNWPMVQGLHMLAVETIGTCAIWVSLWQSDQRFSPTT